MSEDFTPCRRCTHPAVAHWGRGGTCVAAMTVLGPRPEHAPGPGIDLCTCEGWVS